MRPVDLQAPAGTGDDGSPESLSLRRADSKNSRKTETDGASKAGRSCQVSKAQPRPSDGIRRFSM